MDPYGDDRRRYIRARISHKFTQAKGWQFETTVEVVGDANDPVDFDRYLEDRLIAADNTARAEVRRRNKIDGFDAA
jgi:hypothetical protein